MAICTVSGVLKDLSETAISGATVKAKAVNPFFVTTIQITPTVISTTTDTNGAWSLNLSKGSSCVVTIQYPPNSTDSSIRYSYAITVPSTSTANFSDLATEL